MTWLPSRHRRLAATFEDLAARLDAGLAPGDSPGEAAVAWLRRQGLAVAGYELCSLEAAEGVGRLPEVARRLAAGRTHSADLLQKLIDRLAYPVTLIVAALAVTILLLCLGFPLPQGWLLTMGATVLLAGLAVAWFAWRMRDPLFAPERLPVLGWAVRTAGELPYLTALSVLYGAGVPLRTAHREALATARGAWLRARLFAVAPALDSGDGLAATLALRGALTSESLQLVSEGERSGGLEDALRRTIERRRHELMIWFNRAVRVIGVVAYVAAAGSVLWIAASFYGGMLSHGGR